MLDVRELPKLRGGFREAHIDTQVTMVRNVRVIRAGQRIRRRMFLRALGLGLTAPLAAKLADQALAQASGRPKRFMLFFMPHGAPPEHYNPKVMAGDPTNFTLNESGVSVLGPLEPYKQYVNVLQGFTYPEAMTHEGVMSCLSNTPTSNDTETPRTSFEHVMANSLGVKPLILGAVPHRVWGIDKDGMLMWDGTPVVPENNPLKAYDEVFGGLGQGDPSTGPDPNVELANALHSLTEGEVAALKTELSALTHEQTKLQTHLEAIQSLKATGGSVTVSCDTAPTLPAVEALRVKAQGQPTTGTDSFFLREENFPDILAAQLEVAAHAMLCNARQVVAVQSMYVNADIDFGFMGSAGSHHLTLSHTQPVGTADGLDMNTRVPFAEAQKWFTEQLVEHVIKVLDVDDPADPGRKVLDNTCIYWCSEIGEGAWHTTESRVIQAGGGSNYPTAYMPLVTIGKCGGALKSGQVLTFGPDRPAGDLYLALCRAMGVNVPNIGTATQAVQEILEAGV